MLFYFLGRIVGFVLGRLSLRQGYALASAVGYITYLSWPRGRICLWENMAHVLGDDACPKEIERLSRASMCNYFKYIVELAHLYVEGPRSSRRKVSVQGLDNLERALKGGNGVILVGMHEGNWDLLGAVLALDYPMNVIVESFPSAKLNEFLRELREDLGMRVIPTETGGERMVQALRSNELLALLIDVPTVAKCVDVEFFNAVTPVPRGVATLALRTGAKVIPISSMRLPDGSYVAFLGECLRFNPTGELQKDSQVLTQMLMGSLEGFVSQCPDQWYMFRRMWHGGAGVASSVG